MQLVPRQPPGRKTRKARAYAAEIRQLQLAGYTAEAIREALADVGVQVSRSTVQREAHRAVRLAGAAGRQPPPPALPAQQSATPVAPMVQPAEPGFAGDPRSGKEIADAFLSRHIGNPLVRERIQDEDRRDQLLRQRGQDHDRPPPSGATPAGLAGSVHREPERRR